MKIKTPKIGATKKGSEIGNREVIILDPDHSDFILSDICDDCITMDALPIGVYTLIEIRKVKTILNTKRVEYWLNRDNLRDKDAMIERMKYLDVKVAFVEVRNGVLCSADVDDMDVWDRAVLFLKSSNDKMTYETWIII